MEQLKKLSQKVRVGKAYETYFCPNLIPAFSYWLEPLFVTVGNELLRLYITDPEKLTIYLIDENESKEAAQRIADAANKRVDQLFLHHLLQSLCKERGFVSGYGGHYQRMHEYVNNVLGVGKDQRETLTEDQYTMLMAIYSMSHSRLAKSDACGNDALKLICQTADLVKTMM